MTPPTPRPEVGLEAGATAAGPLHDTDARLRSLLNLAPVVLWAVDREGVFTFSEGRALEQLGLRSGDVIGKTVWEVYARVPQVLADTRRALAGEEFTSVLEVAGSVWESRYSPVRGPEGEVVGTIGVAVDVTGKREAERRAQAMAARMRAVAAVSVGILQARTPEALQEVLLESLRRVVQFDAFTLATYDADAHSLSYLAGYDAGVYVPSETISASGVPSEWVIRERRSLLTGRADDPRAQGAYPMGTGRRSESTVRSPILEGERVLGVLAVHSYTPDQYSPEDVEVLEAVAALAATALEHIRVEGLRAEAEAVLLRSQEELEQRVEERTTELAQTNMALEEEIAERERAEEELRQRTAELEAVFGALPDLYFRLAVDGTILDYRAGRGEDLYVAPEHFLGRRIQDVLPPEVADRTAAAMEAVGRTRAGEKIEYSLPVPAGERCFEARLLPLLEDQVVVVVRDVTERREAEEALRRSEEHFRALIENSSDIVTIIDADGISRYQSPSFQRLLGWDPEERTGTRPFELMHPDDVPAARAALMAMMREPGTTHSARFRYRHRDGRWRTLEAAGRTLLPDSTAAGVVVNSRDITDRLDTEEALRRSEERFRSVVENASDLVTLMDADGTIRYQSPAVERLFGYTPEELLGRNAFELVHPEDVEATLARLAEVAAHPGQTRSAGFRWRHKDGSWRYVEATGRTLCASNAGDGVVVSTRDITDRRLVEEALRQAKQEAERANVAKSEFLSRMSHELRTPMNSILGFAQLLERRPLPPDQRRAVDHILKAGRHLLNLINEVLDIARIEADQHHLSLEPVAAAPLLQEALSLIQPLATQREVRIEECSVDPGLFVRADRQRLVQVLLNLLSNGVKYNREGGRVGLVCEEEVAEDGTELLRIGVRDTGPGIPPERMEQLFTPFERLGAENSGVEGTGLGLALSQRLVEAMGGTLTAESTPGEGSTFWVRLARVPSPVESAGRGSGRSPAPARPTAHRPATLLYVEDNLANLALIETILADRPEITLLSALQGQIGLDLAWEHRPDLVLLDLHLPDMEGAEVLRRLQADPRSRGIPVVVISADATTGRIERLRERGAHAYLTKPLDVEEFLDTVDRLLAARGGER